MIVPNALANHSRETIKVATQIAIDAECQGAGNS